MQRLLIAIFSCVTLAACEGDQCRRMTACCAAAGDQEWIGDSCGDLARQTRDERTCATVVDAIVGNYEKRGEAPPAACGGGK